MVGSTVNGPHRGRREKDCSSVAQRTSFAGILSRPRNCGSVSQEVSSQVKFLAKNGADGLWHAAIFLAEAVVSLLVVRQEFPQFLKQSAKTRLLEVV